MKWISRTAGVSQELNNNHRERDLSGFEYGEFMSRVCTSCIEKYLLEVKGEGRSKLTSPCVHWKDPNKRREESDGD